PDPTVIKIGNEYWASATTSNWMPAYPLLKSKDLVNWKTVSHVFMKLPDWADYYFWAPELSYDNGKVYVYYAAHKKGGNLCVGIASADKPEGPYTDHGPLICQEVGSIDAFPMRDENGKLYLIWKEDANSVGKPTPNWAQELNEERTKLIGEKKELFRNDATWEKNLVEGISMVRHGDFFYAFYAAAGCCGRSCTYGIGIARSKSLLGPWEKDPKNPVLATDDQWNCPGHGTPVDKDGKHYFMYHAYDKNTNVYTGREALLIEYSFTSDGWIEFIKNDGAAEPPIKNVKDNFKGRSLSEQWQWSVFQQPMNKVKGGELYLNADTQSVGNFIAQKTVTGNYSATVKVHAKKSTAVPGIAIIGDEKNLIAALYENNSIRVVQERNGKETAIFQKDFRPRKKFYLRVNVSNANQVSFQYSVNGRSWQPLNDTAINGSYLPPWDRAVRVGVISKGDPNSFAVFDQFKLKNESRLK
ncbi:MAG: family 43 glycosylhydrolase, partial [Flavisolibacter sp.]|nr:family 43 glycosylhydrolase [Flavisolibacter sp.]